MPDERYEVWTRADLRRAGWGSRRITHAVRSGVLVRARKNRYLASDAPDPMIRAVRVGGRLSCLSLLALLGVFVRTDSDLHVHMVRGDARMRAPHSRTEPLAPRASREGVVLHWHELRESPGDGHVAIVDALIHAMRCQPPRMAIATLDSALNRGVVGPPALDDVFDALPRRFRAMRPFVDGRAQSGTETLVRLMAVQLGCAVDLQVWFDDVGFVDLLIDGWLVVECDSREFHGTWEQRMKDFRRDRALAEQGYCVLRLAAADILYRPEEVLAALRGLVRNPRRPH